MIHTITAHQLRLVRRQQRQRRALIQAASRLLAILQCDPAENHPLLAEAARTLRAVIRLAVEDGD